MRRSPAARVTMRTVGSPQAARTPILNGVRAQQSTPGDEGTARSGRVGGALGLVYVAYAFGVTMLGTTLPTPLYELYQRQFSFANLLTTVIYAVYAVGVLVALLLFGQASDVLGRRRVLFAALTAGALSAVVFLTDAGLPALFAGRVLSGLSAGAVTGAATAMLVELAGPARRARATMLATVINIFGLGCGPLLAGLIAEYAHAPLRLPYLVHLVLLLLAALAVWRTSETVHVRPGARPRPQRLAVPREVRPVFVPAAIAVFAAFSVFGLLTAIEPGFLGTLLHVHDKAVAGVVVFTMFAASTLGQLSLARLPQRICLPAGCVVLVAGLAAIGAALATSSLALLVTGTVVVGLGHGVCMRAGLTAVTAGSPAHRRAEAVSAFFVAAYVGISLPVILCGVGIAVWGLRAAGIAFTAAVAALAMVAFGALLRLQRRVPSS